MEWYKLKLKDSKKEIEIKDWNFKEECDLYKSLNNLTDQETIKQFNIYFDFVKDHVKDKDEFDCLSKADVIYILFVLRNNSKGSRIDYSFKCTNEKYLDSKTNEVRKCPAYDQSQNSHFNIISDIKYNTTNLKELQVDDELKVIFKSLPFKTEIDLLNKQSDQSETIYNHIIHCIESIIYKGNIQNFTSTNEVFEFLNTLKPKHVYPILDKYKELISDITIIKKNKCSRCKNETNLYIPSLDLFF